MSSIVQAGNHIASAVLMLAVLVAFAGVTAFLLARAHGGRSRTKRKLMFTVVGAVGLVLAAVHANIRLRGAI